MNLPKVTAIASATFITGLIFTASALAINLPGYATDNPPAQNLPNQTVGGPPNAPSLPPRANRGATGSGLQSGKLQSCQARENAIKTRSTHLVQLVTNMESKFDAIAKRIEDYYTSKAVPSGKTVANYDSLVSDIQTKKATIQAALTQVQNDASSFSCTGSDPKTQMTQFRKDMQAVMKALKDYRTSIKNLIVAVHSVIGQESKSATSSSKVTGNQ